MKHTVVSLLTQLQNVTLIRDDNYSNAEYTDVTTFRGKTFFS